MTPESFRIQVAALTAEIAKRPLDDSLSDWLNSQYGPHSDAFQQLSATCEAGVHDGWLCNREGGGIRYGRIFKPAEDLQGFSVDVVDMESIVGPHHVHPQGEIDLVMPLTEGATFDGHGAGWVVYGPGSQHAPTVSQGRALVMYLLPAGEIQFS
jgi:hypothetical protein